ncbi:MAG: flagellar biosynthetic protein FliQ [Spirochaetes bacterium GWF1_31_7]|nr:MAG: flagellar biosynthetic protein FliQ [Spirochaetes bacterium GWE1_32_154]OHD45261.1 MAG: flagellar biosynthetic protein FliQ [Spirochaetes bacterium GWE2_31_10]OHD50556.1 MAG: flagellar biosynthetic protein FliQ [Spirochaetes bacterium GWF1_31_7]OHD78576.1 MAG: flagellar biosynthetic protein FliQ [Spirochaetes bacterium RIFOXYB1_FULL_32_8]HBD94591.1 flagellar biosynthetic protein FliQ [Spirochaetia bacterium]
MDEQFAQKIMADSLIVTMIVSAPMLFSGMIVGLIVSIFQATTSIQEQTLTFVPKMIAIVASIIIFGPWIITTLLEYSNYMVDLMVLMGNP